MKKITLSFLIIFLSSITFGQKIEPYQELVKEFKNRELVILVLEENEEVKSNFKNSEQVTYYEKAIKNYNSLMKEHADTYITYFKGIKYNTVDEIKEWSQEERQKYYYLCYNIADQETNLTIGSVDPGEESSAISPNFYGEIEFGKEDEFLDHYKTLIIKDLGPNYGRLEICGLPVEKKSKKMSPEKEKKFLSKSRSVYVRNLPDCIVEKWSIIFALRSFEASFKTIESGQKPWDYKDLSVAKGKTILICEDDLNKNLLPDNIKSICSTKFEIVSREQLATKIEGKTEGYLYVLCIPSRISAQASGGGFSMTGINYVTELIDNSTCKTVTIINNSKEKLTKAYVKIICDRVGK
mgnify:CR=1 FL=1|jgi:hypothetical protein|tara:strand:+ start:239 stop:1297 length:1059 start_codon:yes stop_codon:yes gene_type:complete